MSDSRSHGLPSPGVCAGIVVAMLAMIAIPAAITLDAVHEPLPLVPVNQHSTPHGYTVSLLLFVFPIAVIAGWSLPRGDCTFLGLPFGGRLPFSFRWASCSTSFVYNGSSSIQLRSNAGHSCSRARQICAGRRVHSSSVRVAPRVLAGRLQHA